jgi:hypothetical protein
LDLCELIEPHTDSKYGVGEQRVCMKRVHSILKKFLKSKNIDEAQDAIIEILIDAFEAGLSIAKQDQDKSYEDIKKQWCMFLDKYK